MTSTWLKNKAIVWALIFVFLFTSVFNTGTAFANTTPVVDQTAATIAEEDAAYVEHIHVWNRDAEHSVEADLSQMTEDNKLEIVVPSDYVGKNVEVEVTAIDGAEVYIDEVSDSPLGDSCTLAGINWTENTGTVSFVVRADGDVMEVYELTLLATGEPVEKPKEESDIVSEESANDPQENTVAVINESLEGETEKEEYTYCVAFGGDIRTVTTTSVTSFNEMGVGFPEPVAV